MRAQQQVLEIKAALILAGTSQAKIARETGRSEAMVSLVVSGKAVSAPIQNAIIEATGRDDLFNPPNGGEKIG